MSNQDQDELFVRHFRIYFRNGHPAYIVDEEGNMYVFHRVTHSAMSGGRKNWKKKNPLKKGGGQPMYIVKKEERDNKGRFSLFKLETIEGEDISYPDIKKAGGSQTDSVVSNVSTSRYIKTNKDKKCKSKKKINSKELNIKRRKK